MTNDEWTFWDAHPPPHNDIVECRRLQPWGFADGIQPVPTGWENEASFWVLPRLMHPGWNVEGVVWRPAKVRIEA
jgi:hypothetical protein